MAFKFGGASAGGTPVANKTTSSAGFGFGKKDDAKPATGGFSMAKKDDKPTGGGFSGGFSMTKKDDAKSTSSAGFGSKDEAKPAATGGGFSGGFSATNKDSAKPAGGGFGGGFSTAKKDDGKPPATTGFGGFSAKKDDAKAATGGGFSMGGKRDTSSSSDGASSVPALSLPSSSSAGPAANDAAATATASGASAGGKFSFAGKKPAGDAGGAADGGADSASSAVGLGMQAKALPTAEYSTLTIDGIINEWTMQLERDIEEYSRQSDKVAMWDNQLRENQKLLNTLMDSVHRILVDQEDLDGSIQAIEAYQRELDTELESLSKDVDEHLNTANVMEPDDGTYTREQIYSMAADLDHHLTNMHDNLDRIIQDYNEGRGGSLEDVSLDGDAASGQGTSTIAKILEVLNTHHDSLSWIDSKARQLQKEAMTLSRNMDNIVGGAPGYYGGRR